MYHRIKKQDLPFITVFLIPGLFLFTVTILVPSIMAIKYSFYQLNSFVSEPIFVGLQNYIEIFKTPRFWRDLWITVIYAGSSVLLQVIFGIIIALILNQRFFGREFLRGVTVVPYIIPSIVVAIGWQWMLDPTWGIINKFLSHIGLEKVQFFSLNLAIWTASLISVWTWTPFVALVFLAGLQTVPEELYESATLDGANKWQQFWKITLPVLKPVITTIVLLRGIWMFNKFDLLWILTGGGPLGRTETLPILAYLYTFNLYEIGKGATVAVVSLLIMAAAMTIYLKIASE